MFAIHIVCLIASRKLFFAVIFTHKLQNVACISNAYVLIWHSNETQLKKLLRFRVLGQHDIDIGDHVHDPFRFAVFCYPCPAWPHYSLVSEFVARAAFHFEDCFASLDPILLERLIERDVLNFSDAFTVIGIGCHCLIEAAALCIFRAQSKGRLRRNFMGYTQTETDLLIGLGASAISDAKYAYAQNLKKAEHYSAKVTSGHLPVFKGHLMDDDDLHAKEVILEIACRGTISPSALARFGDAGTMHTLNTMTREGILAHHGGGFQVSQRGRAFIRNICSVFDQRLKSSGSRCNTTLFSKSI